MFSAVAIKIDMILVPFHMDKTRPEFRLVGIGISRGLGRIINPVGFEVEGQLVHHIAGSDNWEANGLVVFRWLPFPWDKFVDTSFAFGPGISVASETPYYENLHFPNTSRVLMYILWELEMFLPQVSNWRLVGRLHHRSGAYGTFNGVYAGSNYVGLGIKYTF